MPAVIAMGMFAAAGIRWTTTVIPQPDPEDAPDTGEPDRLDEELRQDVAASRADGFADADLPGPLVHRDQHDVHDPDAADEE